MTPTVAEAIGGSNGAPAPLHVDADVVAAIVGLPVEDLLVFGVTPSGGHAR